VGTIRMASERVKQLTASTSARVAAPGRDADAAPRLRWDLGRALELLQTEHFAEALDLVEALPSEAAKDPAVLLLHAVLLTHSGYLDQAQEGCRLLLAADGLNAGAHYVLALCREGMGDPAGAVDHDRMAVYLDPRFAMPRLHLGLMARRARDLGAMRRELTYAIALLESEDASRLLLFGGGFGRDALIALCRAEFHVGEGRS
jgi:chemotaxis protein methyltransferase CheR